MKKNQSNIDINKLIDINERLALDCPLFVNHKKGGEVPGGKELESPVVYHENIPVKIFNGVNIRNFNSLEALNEWLKDKDDRVNIVSVQYLDTIHEHLIYFRYKN